MSKNRRTNIVDDTSSYESSEESVEEIKQPKIYKVADVNNMVKKLFDESLYQLIRVQGEISNFKISRKHLYMTLKDKKSNLNVVCWNFTQMLDAPELKDGTKIIVTGYLGVYQAFGKYQLIARRFKCIGTGDLHKKYIELQQQCKNAGYFDDNKKKKLPRNIKKIGIITALTGAAIQDLIFVLKNNKFMGKVYIKGCSVQGRNCPSSVVKAIKELDKINLDVIVLTRGGGSFEDLFGFSNMKVIKAIYNAKTCIISGIGHEVDHMLSDEVADIFVPTPTHVGHILSKDQKEKYNLDKFKSHLKFMYMDIMNDLDKYETHLCNIKDKIDALNPANIMKDGYGILSYNSEIINNVHQLKKLQRKTDGKLKLKLKLLGGYCIVNINKIRFDE